MYSVPPMKCRPVSSAPARSIVVQRLKQQQSARGPGKDQRALQPQANPDEHVADIAERKENSALRIAANREAPKRSAKRPADLEPQRHPHGTLLYAGRWNEVTRALSSSALHGK